MKRVLLALTVLVGLAMATPAMAQDNAVSGVGAQVACSGGCFVPSFSFLGEVVKYSGSSVGNPISIQIADCCLSGDLYLGTLSGSGSQKASITTSFVGGSSCTTSFTVGASATITTSGGSTAKATMKIKKAGGGFPASAYIRVSGGNWIQTQGSDACGF